MILMEDVEYSELLEKKISGMELELNKMKSDRNLEPKSKLDKLYEAKDRMKGYVWVLKKK